MARSNALASRPRRSSPGSFSSTVTVARWQVRQAWRLLLVTGLGMFIAVILACSVPLYSLLAISAGIRDALNATPGGPYVTVFSDSQQISIPHIKAAERQLDRVFQHNLGIFVHPTPQFSLQMRQLTILTGQGVMDITGSDIQQASQHVKLVEGRLPRPKSGVIEIALLPESATMLHARVGSSIPIHAFSGNLPPEQADKLNMTLSVVGIFTLPSQDDQYWHGENFQHDPAAPDGSTPAIFKVLASNDTLLSILNGIDTSPAQFDPNTGQYLGGGQLGYATPPIFYWYYYLDASHIDVNNLDTMIGGLSATLGDTSSVVDSIYVRNTQAYSPLSTLTSYRNYLSVIRVPATSLWLLLLGVVLYFVSAMTDILVDRKSEAIALLRSRGASRRQVFSSFVAQSIGLGLVVLVLGPLAAILVVYFFIQHTLSAADQASLNILFYEPVQVVTGLLESALLAVVVAILAMMIALYRAARMDMLAVRRESARSTRPAIWQRLRLDVFAALVALVGYGFSLYITSPGVLSIRTRVLILAPIATVGAVFLIIGAGLLFLRGFPWLLRLAAWLAGRGKSAASVLALAQMARAPRQAVRTTMLMALATAFTMFALLFNAAQAQRIVDVASYQVGADFSGKIFGSATIADSSTYAHLPGVLAASVGYKSSVQAAGNGGTINAELRAMDAKTYAQTAAWSAQDSSQPLSTLMRRLVALRSTVASQLLVPAVVDEATWNALNLSAGTTFSLTDLANDPAGPVIVKCFAVAEVQHIPTIDDSLAFNDTGDTVPRGGVLVDFASYETLVRSLNGNVYIPTTDVWLRTSADPRMIAQARKQLLNGEWHLDTPLNDRWTIIAALNQDPLYLALQGLLVIGAVTTLLLALLGTLIAAWQNARSRLTSFAVMRALGSNPSQIAHVVVWEQSIVYTTSLVLGVFFGIFLSLLALPALVFSSLGGVGQTLNGAFYVIQNVPPVQIIIPPSLWITLGILLLTCMLALLMMVRIVSRPSIGQTLRLNED